MPSQEDSIAAASNSHSKMFAVVDNWRALVDVDVAPRSESAVVTPSGPMYSHETKCKGVLIIVQARSTRQCKLRARLTGTCIGVRQ